MKAGDTAYLIFELQDDSGNGLYLADAAAFVAAGLNIYYENLGVEEALTFAIRPLPEAEDWEADTAYSVGDYVVPTAGAAYYLECTTAGTSGSAEPTWDTTPGETTADGTGTLVWTTRAIRGLHILSFEAQAGQSTIVIHKNGAAGVHDYTANPTSWTADVQSSDLDSIRAAINSSIASPGVLTAQDVNLGSVTSNDAYRSELLYVPSATAEQMYGTTDLTGYLITAAAKFAPTDASSISLTCEWETDGSDRAFRISWVTMPAAIVTKLDEDELVDLFIDVQLTKADSSEPFTSNKYTIRIVRDRNPPTSP